MGTIGRFLSWSLQKLTFALLLFGLGLTGLGLWLFLHDRVDFEQRRSEIVRTLTGENNQLRVKLADVVARLAAMRTESAAQQERATQAAKVARELQGLSSGLNRLTTDSAQLRENDERLARMKQMETDALRRVNELELELKRVQWEKDGVEIALTRLQLRLKSAEENTSLVWHCAHEAWTGYRNYLLVAVALFFLWLPLGRGLAYLIGAPLACRRAPVLLGPVADKQPEITAHGVTMELSLGLGDTLWIKGKFLHAADEGLVRKSRSMLDWQIPLTCYAAGLRELTELRNRTPATVYRTTLASQDDPATELSLVTVPDASSFVLRLGYLAGVIGLNGRKLVIRRHWRPFTLQSWIAGQFRYIEFCGPCRLLVADSRGLRAEVLASTKGNPIPVRRAPQDATVGFTPGLGYRSGRSDSFWAYFRGTSPLFDDLFEGQGMFLMRENSPDGSPGRPRKFWAGRWHSLRRMCGV